MDSDDSNPNTLITPTINPETKPLALSAFTSENVPEWVLRKMETKEKEEEMLTQAEKEFQELMSGQSKIEFEDPLLSYNYLVHLAFVGHMFKQAAIHTLNHLQPS